MTNKQESTFSVAAAMLVLFTAILDPKVSVIVSVAILISYAIYKQVYAKKAK